MTTAITTYSPAQNLQRLKAQIQTVRKLREENILAVDLDYGVIPGTAKPTLLKPGAEKLLNVLRLRPCYEVLDKALNFETGFILYQYRCVIVEIDTDLKIGEANGSCNSFEKKYRYRWVSDLPPGVDPVATRDATIEEYQFSVDKAETSGRYGKPAPYWQRFKDAIANGQAQRGQKKTGKGKLMDTWIIPATEYQVPNPEIWDQLNTIDKMAQKRALVSAVLQAANVSDYFTQDVEDMPDFTEAFNSHIQVLTPEQVDEARDRAVSAIDNVTREAEIIEEKTVPFAPNEIDQPPVIKQQPKAKDRRMQTDPTPIHWTVDTKKKTAFFNRAVELGLGETLKEAWAYISEHFAATPLSGTSDLPDYAAAMSRLDELAAALRASLSEDYWTVDRQQQLTQLVTATWGKPVSPFEGLLEAPLIDYDDIPAALAACADLAITQGWEFIACEVEYKQWGSAKAIVFQFPQVGEHRCTLTDDDGTPVEVVQFGGRTNLKKAIGADAYDALKVGEWKIGESHTLPEGVIFRFKPELVFSKQGNLRADVKDLRIEGDLPATAPAEPTEPVNTATLPGSEIPF